MKRHIGSLLVVSAMVLLAGCSRSGRDAGSNDAQDNVPFTSGQVSKPPAPTQMPAAPPREYQVPPQPSGPGAEAAAAKRDVANVAGAMSSFFADCGRYPTTAEGVDALKVRPGQVKNWRGPYSMPFSQKDPWGNSYVYQCPGTHNKNGFDFYSRGPDGKAGTADDIGNWEAPAAPTEQTPPRVPERER